LTRFCTAKPANSGMFSHAHLALVVRFLMGMVVVPLGALTP
jgi:hypothetical protein